jgi:hypothetical protein
VLVVAALVAIGFVVFGGAAKPALAAPIQRQYDYAMKHWDSYNLKKYGDLNVDGGDCANFVSQTLVARGWKMNSAWHNNNAAADWTPAWGYVPSMQDYFTANATQLGLTEYPLDKRSKIRVGDLVMFDFTNDGTLDHVEMVSKVEKVDGKIEIKMSGHNKNTKYSDLDGVLQRYPKAVGHFWHVALPPTASPTPSSKPA